MPPLPRTQIDAIVTRVNTATTTAEKGKALEDLFCEIFKSIPGIEIARRNLMNVFDTEEIDVALWNNKQNGGLDFLPNIILIECKNWSSAIGSVEVSYFKERLSHRCCEYGILIAKNGITGNAAELTCSYSIIAAALLQKTRIIVITLDELLRIQDTEGIVVLLKEKLLDLTVMGTSN